MFVALSSVNGHVLVSEATRGKYRQIVVLDLPSKSPCAIAIARKYLVFQSGVCYPLAG